MFGARDKMRVAVWCRPPTRIFIAPVQQEVTMVDLTRRARLVRELEQEFVPGKLRKL